MEKQFFSKLVCNTQRNVRSILSTLLFLSSLATHPASAQSWENTHVAFDLFGNYSLASGTAKYISTGADGSTWVVDNQNTIFFYSPIDPASVPSNLKGTIPSGVWIGKLDKMPGTCAGISARNGNEVWTVNSANEIYKLTYGSWERIPGAAKQVSVAEDGTVWCLNLAGTPYLYTGNGWQEKFGKWDNLSVRNADEVWYTYGGGKIGNWRRNQSPTSGGFKNIDGTAKQISVASDGTVWSLGLDNAVYFYNGQGWDKGAGQFNQIAISNQNLFWGISTSNTVLRGSAMPYMFLQYFGKPVMIGSVNVDMTGPTFIDAILNKPPPNRVIDGKEVINGDKAPTILTQNPQCYWEVESSGKNVGNLVQLWNTDGAQTKWVFEIVNLTLGTFQIRNVNSGKYLGSLQPSANGVKSCLVDKSNPNSIFKVSSTSEYSESYIFKSTTGQNLPLECENSKYGNSTKIQFWNTAGTNTHFFIKL